MRYTLLLLIGCFILSGLQAQNKPRFSTQNTVGLLIGGTDNAPQLQTVNGVAYHNWYTGIGAGIDWYYQRSIPVFLSVNRFFTTSPRRKVFLSSGAGVNYAWGKTDYISSGWGYNDTKFSPGVYLTAGIGYQISIGKQNDHLLIQLGYNNKTHTQETGYVMPCFVEPCPVSRESYKYSFNALSFRIGWGF